MITSLTEKKGGIRTLNRDTEAFEDFIKAAKLVDIIPKSRVFTWNNKRGGDRKIASRLDRFLVAETILLEGITVDSDILPSGGIKKSSPTYLKKRRCWRSNWNRFTRKGSRGILLKKLETQNKSSCKSGRPDVNRRRLYGRKKSRIQWLKEGEKNTKFFHRSTIDHRSANKILRIKDDQGTSVQTHHEISALLINHFSQIALEPNIDREEAIKDLMTYIPKLITEDQNKALNRAITLEEVEEAVKEMPNGKALGPDGFTIDFYKTYWDIIKTKVWEVVEDSQRFSSILKSLNSTFITLIRKEEEANTSSKFRPSALCNVLYKIISKVIANKLKKILPGIISEEQSSYV
eukprot:PITA_29908